MAEPVDAGDLKSLEARASCGFESRSRQFLLAALVALGAGACALPPVGLEGAVFACRDTDDCAAGASCIDGVCLDAAHGARVGDGGRLVDGGLVDGGLQDAGLPAPDAGVVCVGPDEDGDEVPDACDNCPATPNAEQGDGDDDGVGDACDPRPATPGDSILFFDGFAQDELGAGWRTRGGGQWRVSGGRARQSETVSQSRLERSGLNAQDVVVETQVRQLIDEGFWRGTAGVFARGEVNYNTAFMCGLGYSGGTDPAGALDIHLLHLLTSSYGATNPGDPGFVPALEEPYLLRFTLTGTALACESGEVTEGSATPVTGGYIGLATQSRAASFDYIIAYALGAD